MFSSPFARLCFTIITLAVSLFLARCTFQSDEEFFNEIPVPDQSRVSVTADIRNLENYPQGDTIDIFGTTNFHFSLFGNHGQLESLEASLDGTRIYGTSGGSQSFPIYNFQLTNGIFLLKVVLTMKSGSGSLADKVGAEKFVISQYWFLRVDVSPPPPPEAKLDIENGFLTLRWSAYSKPNFKSFVVKRMTPNGASQTFEIKDNKTNYWKDENYVGGYSRAVEYSVSTTNEIGTATSKIIKRIDPMDVNFSFNNLDSTVTLKWKPTKFYGAFKEYKFQYEDGEDIPALTNATDSTMSCKLTSIRFGGEYSLWFTVRSNSPGIQETATSGTCKLGTPFTFSPLGKVKFNFYLNTPIAVDANQRLLDLNEQLEPAREIATVDAPVITPYPGNYVYWWRDDEMHRLNLVDNTEVIYDYVYFWQQNHNTTVASNGLVCVDYVRLPVRNTNITLLFVARAFDPVTNLNGYYESNNKTMVKAIISDDGKFIWANNKSIFRISGGTSELVGSYTGSEYFKGFRVDNSDELLFEDGDKINIYDTNTLTLIRTINPPSPRYYFASYDPQTKNMLWAADYSSSKGVYTVNIETGETRNILTAKEATSSSSLYIVNGFLIYGDSYIKIRK